MRKLKYFKQPQPMQQQFGQQQFGQQQYIFLLSRKWMDTILQAIHEKFGLTLDPQHKIKKVTFVDHRGNFCMTLNGYLTNGKGQAIYIIAHHWQQDSKQLITYIRIITNNKPKDVIFFWVMNENKIPELREIKEISS